MAKFSRGKLILLAVCSSALLSSPYSYADNSQKAHQVVDIIFDSGHSGSGHSSAAASGYAGPVIPSLQNALSDLERAEKTLMGIRPKLGPHKNRALKNLRNAIRNVKHGIAFAENNL